MITYIQANERAWSRYFMITLARFVLLGWLLFSTEIQISAFARSSVSNRNSQPIASRSCLRLERTYNSTTLPKVLATKYKDRAGYTNNIFLQWKLTNDCPGVVKYTWRMFKYVGFKYVGTLSDGQRLFDPQYGGTIRHHENFPLTEKQSRLIPDDVYSDNKMRMQTLWRILPLPGGEDRYAMITSQAPPGSRTYDVHTYDVHIGLLIWGTYKAGCWSLRRPGDVDVTDTQMFTVNDRKPYYYHWN